MDFDNTLAFARRLDAADPLSMFKEKFHFPLHSDGSPVCIFAAISPDSSQQQEMRPPHPQLDPMDARPHHPPSTDCRSLSA